MLVDIVSKDGNLLVDVGPQADGTLPDIQRQPLVEDGTDVRFTEKAGDLYLILMQRPRERTITIPHIPAKAWRDAHLSGFQKALTVTQQLDFVRITLPEDIEPEAAYAIRLTSGQKFR